MYKTLSLAAIVGAAAAQYTNTIIPTFTIGNSWYTGSLTFTADAGYTTLYNPQGPMAPPADHSETYAFNIFSYLRMTYYHEAFQSYKSTYDFQLNLLNFTPYGQTVSWSRFDSGAGFSASMSGFRDLQLGNFQTRVRENAKTCMWSALNNGGSLNPTCAYNDDKMTDYMDPVW